LLNRIPYLDLDTLKKQRASVGRQGPPESRERNIG